MLLELSIINEGTHHSNSQVQQNSKQKQVVKPKSDY